MRACGAQAGACAHGARLQLGAGPGHCARCVGHTGGRACDVVCRWLDV